MVIFRCSQLYHGPRLTEAICRLQQMSHCTSLILSITDLKATMAPPNRNLINLTNISFSDNKHEEVMEENTCKGLQVTLTLGAEPPGLC